MQWHQLLQVFLRPLKLKKLIINSRCRGQMKDWVLLDVRRLMLKLLLLLLLLLFEMLGTLATTFDAVFVADSRCRPHHDECRLINCLNFLKKLVKTYFFPSKWVERFVSSDRLRDNAADLLDLCQIKIWIRIFSLNDLVRSSFDRKWCSSLEIRIRIKNVSCVVFGAK